MQVHPRLGLLMQSPVPSSAGAPVISLLYRLVKGRVSPDRWFFNNETPQLLAAASGCRWVAVGFRSQRHLDSFKPDAWRVV